MNKNSGFTKFPNELLEKLMTADLTAREYRIILSVIRYTFGYHKESEQLSLSVLSELTQLDRSVLSKVINKLLERNIIGELEKPGFNSGRVLTINTDTREWLLKRSTVDKTSTPTVVERSTPTVSNSPTHTSYIKENNKEIYKYKKNELKNEKKPSYDLELFEQMINSKD